MRIAVINDTVYPFSKGGAQKRVYEISRRLVRRGHELHWYGMDYGATELEGIRLHAVCPNYKMYTREGRRIVTQALRFGMKLNVREPVDIIDCMNFPYLHCFNAKRSARNQDVPLVITWFEFWGKYWHEYIWYLGWAGALLERYITTLPDMIIADSEKVCKQLTGAGVRSNKVRIVPDGVDLKLIKSVEPSKEKYDVVFVGRILAHKNLDILLRAMQGTDASLAVIGDGENREMCEELSAGLGQGKQVKFLGRVEKDENVYALIKSSKVLVLPSTQEGHPLVVPEAFACGVPVVGIKGVCDEFIRHGETGYLSNLHEDSLRKFITCALKVYPRLRDNCLAEAEQYDWGRITDKVEAVYREVLA